MPEVIIPRAADDTTLRVSAIADVVSRSVLVGIEIIGPEDLAIVLKNKGAVRLGHPQLDSSFHDPSRPMRQV